MNASVAILILLAGAAIGALVTWILLKARAQAAPQTVPVEIEVELARLQGRIDTAAQEKLDLKTRLDEALSRLKVAQATADSVSIQSAQYEERASRVPTLETQLDEGNRAVSTLNARVAQLAAELQAQKEQAAQKQQELIDAREYFTQQFELLANRILDEKTRTFSQQSQNNLQQMLDPLKERLKEFQQKVEDVYVKEGKDRSALAEQVKQLMQLSNTMSQDAQNLALALKGDRKAQGNFGEIILEDILERAGLIRGIHYERQTGIRDNDGDSHVIPDIVIHLPADRHLVIDSKFTLPDYRLFMQAADEEQRNAALKRHLTSIRNHAKELSERNYQSLYGLTSLDSVVMFVPLEPAFSVAVTNDAELFNDAWEQNVLLVSPSTLLFVVRTVAYLWRQEDLSKNAKAISNRGAELYDKLCNFVADLQKVGERLEQAQSSFFDAKRKLSEGPGNLIRQAEMLRELGVKPSKSLPAKWAETGLDHPIAIANEQP